MYRPSPFWSWNDKLEVNELRWQIQEMHKAGIGGFFMHARGGLKTAYLSKEWMECVEACLDEANKLNMDAWLYDENGWPSGFGGGIVNNLGVKYQQKYLVGNWVDAQTFVPTSQTIAIYSENNLNLLPEHRIPADYTGKLVYHMSYDVNQFYVDNLDAEVVKKFLEVTHDYYYKNLPQSLQKSLRGIFTDEPQLSRRGNLWSFVLEDEYRKLYNTNLLVDLPALILETENSAAVRIRFWKMVTQLFAENFCKQIYDWCNQHNWQLTGHYVLEEDFSYQIPSNGDIMPLYQFMHVPGMDHLCRTAPDLIAMMQLVSASNQFAKKQIMTESFALTGWNFNFYGMKWMYQIQMAHGINYLCQHLYSYSLRGMRKRDYPGSWGHHMPQWEDYHKINDRFSRIGMLISEGEVATDILVLHNLSSAWKLYYGNDCDKYLNLYGNSLKMLSSYLDGEHLIYHYGDEEIMANKARVDADKKVLKIAGLSYRQVIVPQSSNFSRRVFKLLTEFAKNDGEILVVRNNIEPGILTIDGLEMTTEELNFYNSLTFVDNELSAAKLAAKSSYNTIQINENTESAMQILSLTRKFSKNNRIMYYLVNSRYNLECKSVITIDTIGRLEKFNPDNGKFEAVTGAFLNRNNQIELNYNFAPSEDLMLFVNTNEEFVPSKKISTKTGELISKISNHNWQLIQDSDNILTLDRCRYRVDGGDWEFNDVSVIHSRLLKLERPCKLEMEFSFVCDAEFNFEQELKLAVEDVQNYQFMLNGVAFEAKSNGYKFDKAFEIINLPQPKLGENILTLSMNYCQSSEVFAALRRAQEFETEYNKLVYDMEVESIYLVGNFGVKIENNLTTLAIRKTNYDLNVAPGVGMFTKAKRYSGNFVLSKANETINLNNIVENGYPFFAGKLNVSKMVNLDSEEVEQIRAITFDINGINSLKLKINGKSAGELFYPPFKLDISNLLQVGDNNIELELTISLRNMLGPFHLEEGESGAVHTLSFSKEATSVAWTLPPYNEQYCLVEMGLEKISMLS